MRIREILFEVRIYNQDYLNGIINHYSGNLPQKAQDFFKRIIITAAQDPNYQSTPKLKSNATEWDKKDLANRTLVSVNFNSIILDKLIHIRDWLRNPDITEQELNSLRGIQDIDIANEHADRFFARLNKKASSEEDVSGLETIMTWPDGFKLVKLNTAKCLNREGKLMQHCVGSYAHKIKRRTEILSLRDPQNNPHVTIEKNGNDIDQIKGKQNEAPIEKYHKYIIDYLNKNNFDEIDDLHNIGLIKVNDKIYELNNLPENLLINGNFDISYLLLKNLPKGLKITGSLFAYGSALRGLPDDLEVGSSINISNTNIKELPKSWERKTINGDLNISYCQIKELPSGLKIIQDLSAHQSNLTSLPDDLDVKGSIDISNTKIRKLPKSLNNATLHGNLNISYCQIKELPENLTVDLLYIRNTLITKLPDTLQIEHYIVKSRDMKLTYIPEHLRSKII